jgi:hypothetical protein
MIISQIGQVVAMGGSGKSQDFFLCFLVMNMVAKFASKPSRIHFTTVKRMYKYL